MLYILFQHQFVQVYWNVTGGEITQTLENGNYNWSVGCFNQAGEGNSSVYNLSVDVLGCGETLTESTTLIQDLYRSDDTYCLTIAASDVTLDCDGYQITGNNTDTTGGTGVRVNGAYDNITIKNCYLHNLTTGITTNSITNSLIYNNTVNATRWGIGVEGGSQTNVTENYVYNSTQHCISFTKPPETNNWGINNTLGECGIYGMRILDNNITSVSNTIDNSGGTRDIFIEGDYFLYQDFEPGSSYQISNPEFLSLEQTEYGKINFLESFSETGIIGDDVRIEDKFLWINGSKDLNVSAENVMYNVPYQYVYILRDGVECPDSICTVLSYTGVLEQSKVVLPVLYVVSP